MQNINIDKTQQNQYFLNWFYAAAVFFFIIGYARDIAMFVTYVAVSPVSAHSDVRCRTKPRNQVITENPK